jgi:urease accessory protein
MITRLAVCPALALAVVMLDADPALAHHVMGGRTPSSFIEGILSGLGHPIIGLDHLAFLIAVGVAVGIEGLSLLLPGGFVAASVIGVVLHVSGVKLPATELVVAGSVVLAGLLIARGATLVPLAWSFLLVLAGLFHGYAYGESILGAEAAPVGAYLTGLLAVQTVLATGIAIVVRRCRVRPTTISARLTGAAIAGLGLGLLGHQVLPG